MTDLINGSLAASLCVVAVAILGMLLLTGRLPLRRGAQVILGCFLLLGSSALASAVARSASGDETGSQPNLIVPLPLPAPTTLPPKVGSTNPFDPYSGA